MEKKLVAGTFPGPSVQKYKRKVLKEEEYLSSLGAILRRDFFPTLDKLEAQYDYLTAMELQDLSALRDAADRLSHLENARKRKIVPEDRINKNMSMAEELKMPVMSLDEFQARYVTEDTADFEELLEKFNAFQRTRSLRLGNLPSSLTGNAALLLEADPNKTKGSQGVVCPAHTRLEREIELGVLERDPTDIRYHYWRILKEFIPEDEEERELSIRSAHSKYEFVETPARNSEQTSTPKRTFRIPPTPRREALGQQLVRDRIKTEMLKSSAVRRLLRQTPRQSMDSVFATPRRTGPDKVSHRDKNSNDNDNS